MNLENRFNGVCIKLDHAGYDAVYLHSENPNSHNFPYQFDEIDCKNKWLIRHKKTTILFSRLVVFLFLY